MHAERARPHSKRFFWPPGSESRDGVCCCLESRSKEESAVQQILQSEMADVQQTEALKAQAILVRWYLRTSKGRHQKDGYDFCDTTHCQFFTDFKSVDDRFRQAAIDTRGTCFDLPRQALSASVHGRLRRADAGRIR